MFFNSSFYYVTIALQIICVVHCLRKGMQTGWVWLIVFLPLAGCIAYIVLEMINRSRMQQVQSGVEQVIFSTSKIKKLEKQLQFSDTFKNRILLADAYLAGSHISKAIALYKSSLTGAFAENEHVLMQLIFAYFSAGRFNDVIAVAEKMYSKPQFIRSHAHVLYAMALDKAANMNYQRKNSAP